ncbi:MAG: hypothetical protein EA424_18950, partial [Planctomycetaceae bacterium]
MAIPGFRRLLGKSEKRRKDQRRESRRHHFQKTLGRRLVHETLESRQLLSATPNLSQDAIDAAIQRSTDLTLYDPTLIQEAQQWVIRVEEGTNIRELASAMGTDALLPTGLIPNTYYFKVPEGAESALDILESHEQLDFFYPLIPVPATFRFEPNDPLFPDQWHLVNTGQTGGTPGMDANVTGAWESVSGAGVVIGIVDDGVQYTHPDLAAKYRPELSYDFFGNDPDPMPFPGDAHGTAVAGVAAAVTDNDLGVAGAGRDADIAALRLLTIPDNVVANMLIHQNQNIHIYNHSYGPPDTGRLSTPIYGPGPLTLAALQESVTTGRGGLGNIHVWAAGNGLLEQDNVNYDGYANSRFTIAVAAVDHDGRQSFYSEPGAPIIVTAPSSPAGAVGITTTDLMAPDGYNPDGDYTNDFGGTSSSAPLVSGVISLVLEANPDLTYRDVQHILVNTARHNDPTDPDWTTNASGRLINHKYGFGMIDATAAVEAAQSWTTVPDEISYGSGAVMVGASIPEGSPEGATSTISVPQDINIEWVEVVFNATHPQSGDLQVELIAPSGTSSILAETRPVINAGVYSNWVFTSARHWGEDSEGDWTLVVRDQGGLGTGGTFNSWQLNVYGTESIPDPDRPPEPPAREIPAIGPQLIAARPNEGHLLLPNKVNDPLFVAPREVQLLFQGGGNIAAGMDLSDAIRITRQGSDGAFDYAYAKTDFYTGAGLDERDRVELKIEAVLLGEKQDGITVTFTTSDHGSDDRQPIIHVNGRMITVDLNAQEGFETTGGVLQQALNSHPATSRLIRATVSGNTALPLTDNLPRAASVVSDMNTITSPRLGGWAELEFTAVNPGTAGNDIQLVVTKSDHDNRNMAPFINVDGTTISIDLNSQDGYRTRAQQLVDAINQHPEAGALIQGRVVAGNLLADLAAVEIDYSPLELQDGHDGNGHPTPLAPLVLAGAGKAEVSSSFGIQGLEVVFRATEAGPESNGLQVAVLASSLNQNQAPRVRVDGRKITVTLNTHPTTPRVTARDLVDAINAHAGASALVQASIVLGDYQLASGATEPAGRSIAAAAPLTLRLDGADEIITPGYIGLGDTGSEVILRFAQTLPDDHYRIEIFAVDDPNRGIQALRNAAGIPLTPSQAGADREIIDLHLNLAPQIISVVPQPVTKPIRVFLDTSPPGGQFQLILQGERTANLPIAASAADVQSALEALTNVQPGEVRVTKPAGGSGGVWEIAFFGRYVNLPLADLRSDQPAVRLEYLAQLQQATDQVLVYFNEDELLVEAAENPAHYRLVDTAGTATIEDDRILVPEHVRYYPEHNLAVLTFDGRLPHATYRLEIGQTSGSHGTMDTAISVGTLFDTTGYENLSWLNADGSELYRIWLPETADLDVVVVPDSALSAHGQLDARIDLLTPAGDPVGPMSNEVRTLAYAGATPVAGQFELTFAGQTTVPLDFDAMALDIQNALSALATPYPIVSVTGGPLLSAPIQIEFEGASIPDLQITSDSTNGRLGVSMQDRLQRSNLPAGTYYVRVSSIDGLGTASSGSYFLQMNSSATVSADDNNSSFTTATNLGILGAAGQDLSAVIQPQSTIPMPPWPGGIDHPGHRDTPAADPILVPPAGPGAVAGTEPFVPAGITQFPYFFGDVYGVDAQGNALSNQITAEQRIRAREIFDLWAVQLGIEFIEVTDPAQQATNMLQVVTGEPRVVDFAFWAYFQSGQDLDGITGVTNTGQFASIINAQAFPGSHDYGDEWFVRAMYETGRAIGLGTYFEQLAIMGESDPQRLEPSYTGPNPEPVFPFDADLTYASRIYRPDSTDIDLYKFELAEDGWFAAETVAQRQASLLDTVLTLFDIDGNVVARNDDYYGKDSLVEVHLTGGTYYVGVTSTGNTAYDPTVRDSGFGGTTDGEYQLQLRFLPDRENALVDASAARVELDGDNDGRPGGLFQFWFQAGDESIFVDKSVSTSPGNPEGSGTAADPYDSIAWAIADSAARIVTPARGLDAIEDGDSFVVYLGATPYRFEFDLNGDGVRTSHTPVIVHPVQTLAFDRVPVSGQFRLTFAGQETAPLSFSASNDDIRNALIALPNINAADIRVTGGPINTTPVDIQFLNHLPGTYVSPITVSSNTTAATLRVIEDQRSVAVAIKNAVNSLIPPASALASLTPAGTAVRIEGATRVDVKGSPGLLTASNLVRIVGNPGTDNDPNTLDDSHAYLIGTNNQNLPLEDGNGVTVPQGVTMMIDEGALLKLRRANIDVGLTVTNVDRRGGALQVLGTPDRPVLFRSFHDDDFGGDTDPNDKGPEAGDWGGLVLRASSDLDREGIFLNWVNHADLRHGGGKVFVGSVQSDFTPIYLATARPTIAYNTITNSAGAAISADPNSFNDRDGRIGPDIFGNQVVDNSINGLLVRIRTQSGAPLDKLSVNARFDDTDIVHVISENLHIVGNPGGPVLTADGLQPRLSGRLAIDPGVVVKLASARIEAERGASNLIAEGTEGYPIVFTSIADDTYGFGGTFDTNNDRATANRAPQPGDWGGLIFNALSHGSLDRAVVTYGGGEIPIAGGFARFNAIEVQQADFRMTRSLVQNNASGLETNDPQRNGRLSNEATAIFVRGAQPVIVDNVIRNNQGAAIHINANSLNSQAVVDSGRSTGPADRFAEFDDNYGPLIRMNRLANNDLNGLHVRGAMLTVAGVWDDTDIVHVVQDEIMVVNQYVDGGLRLQSSPRESLVVKLDGDTAGFTASGTPMDIDDRIGGSLQILGTVGHPVVLTSLYDCTVGAGFRPDGMPQNSTLTAACPPGSDIDVGFSPGPVSIDLTTTNANLLRDQLLGPGVTAVGDATLVSGASSAGLFSGGSTSIRIPTGVVLSTGDVRNVEGPNTFGWVGNQQASLTGDPDLNAEFGVVTTDTTSLEFQIQLDPGGPQDLFFSYVFASDEYNQFANSPFNDVFAFFVNGQNIAFIPGTTTPISINTINGGYPLGVNAQNPQYFNNNDPFDNGAYLADFGLDGFTNVFIAEARNLGPGVHTIKLAISDVLDTIYDSAVFLRSGSFANVPLGIPPEPGDWRSIRLDQYSHDRNVSPSNEQEFSYTGGHDVNGNPDTAEHLGALAPDEKSGDETRRLGFEVRGHISLDDPTDMDVYSFDAESGTTVWFDIDRTDPTLNTVLELIDSRGEVLASSEDLDGTLAESLTPQPWIGDYFSVNRHDAGMRVTLPGEPGETGTYFIRVRSAGPMLVDSPLTSLVFKDNGEGNADQITVTSVVPGENFLDRGFEAGQRLYVRNSSAAGRSNDGVYTIASVTAGPNFQTITLDPRDRLVDQGAPTGTILRSGVTSGAYQLQVRLRQTDEQPGSTIRHADIRYAGNGIEVIGLPSHSNLLGETAEVNDTANNTAAGAQNLGNVLLSERNVVSVSGSMSSPSDVDWYSFSLDYDFLEDVPGLNDGQKTFPLVIDVDYADGLTRADTTLALYRQDADGIRLIAIARESNIQDDQPLPGQGLNLDDL